jgi:hypothetical protein
MKRSTLPLARFLLLPVLPGQDPNAKKDPDPEVAEKLGDLDDIVTNRKMERDAEAGAVLTALILKWRGGLCEKDQKQIVKGIGNVFLKGKVRPAEQAQIYIAAATALGETDESGADPLEKAFESKRFPDKPEWVQLRESLLRAMGKTKNEKKVKFLIDTAQRHPVDRLQAAAGEALGNFSGSDQKIRKEIVDKLLIRYGSMDSRARVIDPADIEAQNMRDRLAVIRPKWNDTLSQLTGENFDKFPEWQAWWNKNKSKNWQ